MSIVVGQMQSRSHARTFSQENVAALTRRHAIEAIIILLVSSFAHSQTAGMLATEALQQAQ